VAQEQEKLVRRNVMLFPEDFETIRDFGKQSGLSFSSALRFIVREWKRQKELRQAAREAAFVLRQAAENPLFNSEVSRNLCARTAETLEKELGIAN